MCRLVERLFALIPIPAFRAWLLRSHIEACTRCRNRYEPAGDIGTVAALPEWIRAEESLWPKVRERIRLEGLSPDRILIHPVWYRGKRRWAIPAAAVGLLLVALAGFLVFGPSSSLQDPSRVTIIRAESNGRRASAHFYQTREASYVWISTPEKMNGDTHEK